MNPFVQLKKAAPVFLVGLALAFFGLLPQMQAVSPTPDGCYPNFTTTEGCDALNFLTTGAGNTALGWRSLFLDSTGSFNTGVGGGALALNNADSNTAVGAAALLLNTTGTENTATGTDALVFNTSGSFNDAVGAFALSNNIDGNDDNAFGDAALQHNIHGNDNTAIGDVALANNDTTGAGLGNENTAVGAGALFFNTDGDSNTAVGFHALFNNTTGSANITLGAGALFGNISGDGNTAVGVNALPNNTTGTANTALGVNAGLNVTTATNVIAIGTTGQNISNSCFIGNIFGVTIPNGIPVVLDSFTGQLGEAPSSERFKTAVKPIGQTSEAILALKPVTFRYKRDKTATPQFGLIAEDVAVVNPDLVVRDKNGEVYTVRYEAVNVMLLNEFLKEHRKVEEQNRKIQEEEATITQLEKEMGTVVFRLKEQDSKIQKVSEQLAAASPSRGGLEASKFAAGRIRVADLRRKWSTIPKAGWSWGRISRGFPADEQSIAADAIAVTGSRSLCRRMKS